MGFRAIERCTRISHNIVIGWVQETGAKLPETEEIEVLERIQSMQSLLERLLLEKISLTGIARVLKVSERWLQSYVNQKYQDILQEAQVQLKPKLRLTLQMDELWSFVDYPDN